MDILENAIILFLVFGRISGIFLLTPIFGSRNIPLPLKIGLAGMLTMIASPLVSYSDNLNIINVYQLLYYILFEFLIGLIFGFIALLILNGIYLAGVMVDRSIGFSIVSVMSVQDEGEVPITANFYYTIALLVFLATNMHHTLIRAVIYSFRSVPIGYDNINLLFVDKVVELLRTSFVLGFKMAAPIVITIFATNVLMGILSRAMPQMNVFIVGMPLNLLIGLITLLVVLPFYFGIFNNIFSIMFDYIQEVLNGT